MKNHKHSCELCSSTLWKNIQYLDETNSKKRISSKRKN